MAKKAKCCCLATAIAFEHRSEVARSLVSLDLELFLAFVHNVIYVYLNVRLGI